jgi:hypothetical protein
MVIEAVIEDIGLKQRIFADLEASCAPHAILATNTSTIDIELVGAKLKVRRYLAVTCMLHCYMTFHHCHRNESLRSLEAVQMCGMALNEADMLCLNRCADCARQSLRSARVFLFIWCVHLCLWLSLFAAAGHPGACGGRSLLQPCTRDATAGDCSHTPHQQAGEANTARMGIDLHVS